MGNYIYKVLKGKHRGYLTDSICESSGTPQWSPKSQTVKCCTGNMWKSKTKKEGDEPWY